MNLCILSCHTARRVRMRLSVSSFVSVTPLSIHNDTLGQFPAELDATKKSIWRDIKTCLAVFVSTKTGILGQDTVLSKAWVSKSGFVPKPDQIISTALCDWTNETLNNISIICRDVQYRYLSWWVGWTDTQKLTLAYNLLYLAVL